MIKALKGAWSDRILSSPEVVAILVSHERLYFSYYSPEVSASKFISFRRYIEKYT